MSEIETTPSSVQALMNGANYEILSYFPYPTGYDVKSVLKEVDADSKEELTSTDKSFCEFIDNVHKTTLQKFDPEQRNIDHKAAVELLVEGFAEPVYLARYDSQRAVTTGVRNFDSIAKKPVPQG